MARKTRNTSPKTRTAEALGAGNRTGEESTGLDEDASLEAEESHDEGDLGRLRVDPVWRRRMNARRKLEAYWEEKRLRAMIGDPLEEGAISLD